MGDIAMQLEAKLEILRGAIDPAGDHLRTRHGIKRGVTFNRGEALTVEVKQGLRGAALGVEVANPARK